MLTSILRLKEACGVDNFMRLAEYKIGAHIDKPAFVCNTCALLRTYNTERVMSVLCTNSVVANIGQPAWMAVLDQLIVRHGEERALQLAGKDPIACRLLKPPYLSMVNEWMPVLGSRLPSLLDAAAFRWVNLLDFLPFYRDHKKWTRVMTRKLMKGIPQTKTDQVKEEIWVGIYRKD